MFVLKYNLDYPGCDYSFGSFARVFQFLNTLRIFCEQEAVIIPPKSTSVGYRAGQLKKALVKEMNKLDFPSELLKAIYI